MVKRIIEGLKNLIFKLYFALLRLQMRVLNNCKIKTLSNIRALMYLKAKLANGSLVHSDSADEELKKYTHIADQLLEIHETDTVEYVDSFGDISSLIVKAKDIDGQFINEAKKDCQEIKSIYDDVNNYLSGCKEKSDLFDFKTFTNKVRLASDKCIKIRKKYDKHIKNTRNQLAEARRAPHKYDITEFSDLFNIAKLATIFTIVAYVGGYTYIWGLFNQLDFRFSGFFSASDYLLATLSQTIYAIIFFGIMYFSALSKRVDMASDSKYMTELRESQNRKYFDPLIFLIVIYFIGVGFLYRNNAALVLGLIMAITFYGLPYVVNRYFKPSLLLIKILSFIVCLFVYLAFILYHTYTEHYRIISSKVNSGIVVYLDNGQVISKQVFVMKNSEYFFYYDIETKRINVIPKSHVYRAESPVTGK